MRNRGFTLLEVVLAIGLSAAVLGLLTMTIDMYLFRVDASRTQVETSQLARTLLKKIASDLRAVHYVGPSEIPTSDSTTGGSSTGGSGTGNSGSSGSGSGDSDVEVDPSTILGIFGTATEIRIDRSPLWNWESLVRQTDAENPDDELTDVPNPDAMPQTIRYLVGEGDELLASKLAAEGVSEELTASSYAGLYREQLATVAWQEEYASGPPAPLDTENANLIAPEVVELTFAYFDGEQLFDSWDSSVEEELPKAIEIKIIMLQEPFEQAVTRTRDERDELRRDTKNLVEYRLFVRLPDISAPETSSSSNSDSQSR